MDQHEPGSIVVGVDVGGPKKGFHAVALQDGQYRQKFSTLAEENSLRNQYRSDRCRLRIGHETVVDDCMAADREQCLIGGLFPVLQRMRRKEL